MSTGRIQVTVPADPRFVRVVRMVANRSAATAGMGYDRIEDLALAIDEAGTELLRLPGASTLEGLISSETDGIHVRLAVDAGGGSWPPTRWDESLGALVLGSLARDIRFERDDDQSVIHLAVG
jgi:serine/threonine-protein kinase RsbW